MVVDAPDGVAMVEHVVDPISVGLDAVSIKRRRPWSRIQRGRDRTDLLVEGAGAAFEAHRNRRTRGAGLGDDVDDASDGVIAIEHGATVAARNFTRLARITRNRRKIHPAPI